MHTELEKKVRGIFDSHFREIEALQSGISIISCFEAGKEIHVTLTKDKLYKRYMKVWNIVEILYSTINSHLHLYIDSGPNIKMISKENLGKIWDMVSVTLNGMPYSYTFQIELPFTLPSNTTSHGLGESAKIFSSQRNDTLQAEDKSTALGFLEPKADTFSIFQVKAKGYIKSDISDSAGISAFGKLKQFIVLAIGFELLYEDVLGFYEGGNKASSMKYFHEGSDIKQTVSIPSASLKLINSIRLKNGINSTSFSNQVEPIAKYMNVDDDNPDKLAINTAVEWGFEAFMEENTTFEFIKLCIALEALLGDGASKVKGLKFEEKRSITETFADRGAYLVGKSRAERLKIKDTLKEIYILRSQLVHGNKHKLSEEDYPQLVEARNLFKKLIAVEAMYLLA